MDTSVTAHCHAAAAVLTRAYQSDYRRHVLTPTTTRAAHHSAHAPPVAPTRPVRPPLLDNIFHIRSAERGTSGAATGGGGRRLPRSNEAKHDERRTCAQDVTEV